MGDLEQPLTARGCCTRSLCAAAVERDSAGRKETAGASGGVNAQKEP